jgi:hypothetical protein
MASIIKVDTIKDTSDNTLLSTSSGNVSISNNLIVDTDTLYVDSTNNEVGMGTTLPDARLHIQATSATSGEDLIKLSNGADACELVIDTSANAVNFNLGTSDVLKVIGGNGTSGSSVSSDITFVVDNNGDAGIQVLSADANSSAVRLGHVADPSGGFIKFDPSDNSFQIGSTTLSGYVRIFSGNGQEQMRILGGNTFLFGTTTTSFSGGINWLDNPGSTGTSEEEGWAVTSQAAVYHQTHLSNQMLLNDSSASPATHNYILFRYNGATIGDIDTTNNSTVRYNTFTGGHWSQFHDGTNPELKTGTVMSLTGDKLEYSKCEKTVTREDGTEELQKFEIAGTHEIGSEVTVPNDEYGEEDSITTATVVSNYNADHLVKVKVSDSVADKAVYGVWAGKYNDGDLSVEALGTSKIRIKQGEVLEVGDLLESAGDGTAQKQSDDIIKNSTIAKVTSPIAIETFDDNSFLVSCVLYCG